MDKRVGSGDCSAYLEKYEEWMGYPELDREIYDELQEIAGSHDEIKERFYQQIQFGTGGLRGIIGAGTDRMNVYTVRKATQGLAQAIQQAAASDRTSHEVNQATSGDTYDRVNQPVQSVVIAYDCRHKSRYFAEQAAMVLAANGIRAYLFRELQPTPVLSFAVRHLHATAGIVVTASHNPPQYNGYKVYWSDGAQVASERAEHIMGEIATVDNVFVVPMISLEQAEATQLLVWLETDGELMDEYFRCVSDVIVQPEIIMSSEMIQPSAITAQPEMLRSSDAESASSALKIVFTPLHGTTGKPLLRALHTVGFTDVCVVDEQFAPDPNFSTVASPNPEEREAFTMAIACAEREGADIILGTDPDGDRLGVLARDSQGKFVVLTGNQTGALMLEYLLSQYKQAGRLTERDVIIKTVVTSELGRVIAARYGVMTEDTLTGFKYIGEKIEQYEQSGDKRFLFGYEESYGYLIKPFARDKDAIQASVLICEIAAFCKQQGKSLVDFLESIYEQYGYYKEALTTISLAGLHGQAAIAEMMSGLRNSPLNEVAGMSIAEIADYHTGEKWDLLQNFTEGTGLPKSNVIKYTLTDGSWFCVRPSGTEPKIKFYFAVRGATLAEADDTLERLRTDVLKISEKSSL